MSNSRPPERQEFKVAGLPAPLSHYTDAVRFGNVLFVSGLTAHDSEGQLVGGTDSAEQTRQIFGHAHLRYTIPDLGSSGQRTVWDRTHLHRRWV